MNAVQPLKAPSAEAKAAVDGILNALSAARSGATVHGWTHEDPNVVIVLAAYESLDVGVFLVEYILDITLT